MKFNIEKKGYCTQEVDNYLKRLASSYSSTLDAQTERINLLKEELKNANSDLDKHNQRAALVTSAIYNAVQKADEIENLAKKKYEFEIERLKAFHEKWLTYYNTLLERYPVEEELLGVHEFSEKLKQVFTNLELQGESNKNYEVLERTYESEQARLEKAQEVKNKEYLSSQAIEKIKEYFKAEREKQKTEKAKAQAETVATKEKVSRNFFDSHGDTSSGFLFEEALSPKDDLEIIMKELLSS